MVKHLSTHYQTNRSSSVVVLRVCLKFTLLAILLLCLQPASATVYNCSTLQQIRDAMANAVAGDEIVIVAGTYTASNVAVSGSSAHFYGSANGTASNPIIIRSQSASNKAILAGSSQSSLTVLRIVGDYWIVKDLKIRNAQKGLIFDNANHCQAITCEVYDIGYEGIHVRDGSDYTTIDGCNIHHTGTVDAGFGEGIYIGTDKGSWSSYDPYVSHTTVKNCTIGPYVAAEAFDIKEGTSETIIEYCTIDATGISGSNFADSFIDLKGIRTYVRYNTFNRNNASNLTKGIAAIDRGVANSCYEHAIHDNIFNMDNSSSGNMVEAYSGTSDVYAWDNVRNPSGGNYNSGVTASCCPSWYSPPGGCTAPGSLGTSGITASSVTFSWGSVSGASNYDLQYRVNGTGTWTNVSTLTSTSHTQSGLTANTTYQWQIRTDCGTTQSSYTVGSNFTTSSSGGGSTTVVYSDALATDWNNYSFTGTYDFNNTTNVQVGSKSIKATYGSWGGVLVKKGTVLNTSGMTSIRFWVKGEGNYLIRLKLDNKQYEFTTSTSWQQITVPLSTFGSPSSVEGITFQNRSASSRVVYYDQIEFVSGSSLLAPPEMFAAQIPILAAFPNPVSNGQLQIDIYQSGAEGQGNVMLYDITGKLVFREEIDFDPELTSQKINLSSHLPAGVYLLRVENGNLNLQQRILIQNN